MSELIKNKSPLKSIKQYCFECSGDNKAEVRNCELKDCPLYKYRMGKTGYHKEFTTEQKLAFAERIKALRKVKS